MEAWTPSAALLLLHVEICDLHAECSQAWLQGARMRLWVVLWGAVRGLVALANLFIGLARSCRVCSEPYVHQSQLGQRECGYAISSVPARVLGLQVRFCAGAARASAVTAVGWTSRGLRRCTRRLGRSRHRRRTGALCAGAARAPAVTAVGWTSRGLRRCTRLTLLSRHCFVR